MYKVLVNEDIEAVPVTVGEALATVNTDAKADCDALGDADEHMLPVIDNSADKVAVVNGLKLACAELDEVSMPDAVAEPQDEMSADRVTLGEAQTVALPDTVASEVADAHVDAVAVPDADSDGEAERVVDAVASAERDPDTEADSDATEDFEKQALDTDEPVRLADAHEDALGDAAEDREGVA